MAKAQIKTSSGTQITIEGDASEVAKIISMVEQEPRIAEAKKVNSVVKEAKKEAKKAKTAMDLMLNLKEEGFFSKPKNLSEIRIELEKQGRLIPTTTLSGVMLSLVQKKFFERAKKESGWVYVGR